MAAPLHMRGYSGSRESSSNGPHSTNIYPYPHAPPLSAPFEDRFPQPSTSFGLPHNRTASTSSSTSRRSSATSESARSTGGGGGGILGAIPRTTSSSTWGDYSHDVELLLGEEGRGKSPSRNGEPRSATPSRSNSQLSQSQWPEEDRFSQTSVAGPSTPRSSSGPRINDDQDTTPKGQLERSTVSPSSSRPLHTPPQMFPSSPAFNRTSFDSATQRSRMSSQTSSYSAFRPSSAQSSSSNSSTYSVEDNSWATDLAPSHDYDYEVASPRAPLFADNTSPSIDHQSQARPLSEFDFAAAYARSDGGGSLPNSPMLPTVGIVQPASPVAPSYEEDEADTTSKQVAHKIEESEIPSSSISTPPESDQSKLSAAKAQTTPSSSRAPSPTPSLSLSPNRPSSRASSNRSVSSPVRPPRRVASAISLVPKPASVLAVSPTPSSSSTLPPSEPSHPELQASSSTPTQGTVSTTASPAIPSQSPFVSPRGSPRAPSIPEKSRRRASTLGVGIKKRNGHGRSESRDTLEDSGTSRPGSIIGVNAKENGMEGFSNPDTPLSASDFADVYGKLHDDPEWDNRSTTSSLHTPSNASASPASKETKQPPQHTRDAASSRASFDSQADSAAGDEVADSSRMHHRDETIKARVGGNDVFKDDPTAAPLSLDTTISNGTQDLTTPTERTSRSATPRGDAKARAAAFIADLKRSRQEAERGQNVVVDEDETIKIQNEAKTRDHERVEEEDTIRIDSPSLPVERPPLPKPASRPSDSSVQSRPPSRSQPSSRSSTLPYPKRAQQPTLPPLLRRRPLPMAIQASEVQKARTAGERARIYAAKINELNREKSRLDEWIDAVRKPRSAVGRPLVTSPTASPLKTARSFRQDASTATFAPRGDGYRAKEIVTSTFGPRDLQPTNTPYPGVLNYTSNLSNISSTSSQRSLGSGLPAVSAQPGSGSKGSFFSRSLGRRTSKRDPPSHSASSGVSSLPISNPSPLLYSSSSTTTTAPHNLRSLGGPRMPGAISGIVSPHPKLNSRASFDSRAPTPTNSTPYTTVPHPHRASFSFGSGTNTASPSSIIPNSPNSFSSMSTSPSPLLSSSSTNMEESDIDQDALNRLIDVLPQAPRGDLVKSLRKAGGMDDILAISIYLSEREAGLK